MKQPIDREKLLFQALINTFEKLGMDVEFSRLSMEDIRGRGGLCRVKGERKIIIDKDLSVEEMNSLMASELSTIDVEGVFLPPIVRDAMGPRPGDEED